MIKYNEIHISDIHDTTIDKLYADLLITRLNFFILKKENQNYILTKERSFFQIDDLNHFISLANDDIYYKTMIWSKNIQKENYLESDLKIFKNYLDQYKASMTKQYGNEYLFGCIAVRTKNDSFITTIRGKKSLNEFTLVISVDDNNHIVNVNGKKATLNAPLLNHLFENKRVKAIVHLHDYNNALPYDEYAFPGTIRDSFRKNNTSFNISQHGFFLLFDKNGKRL